MKTETTCKFANRDELCPLKKWSEVLFMELIGFFITQYAYLFYFHHQFLTTTNVPISS